MKKLIVAIAILAATVGKVQAAAINTDLFPFQNYTATMTKVMDFGEVQSFSIQLIYSTATQPGQSTIPQSGIDVINDVFTSSYTYGLGQPLLLVVGSSAPTGIVAGTTYYSIPVTNTLFKLSGTSTGAVAGVSMDITATSTSTLAILNPLTISMGTCGITWDASNDGSNFSSTGSSVTITAVGAGNQLRDFGAFPYRYLRMTYNGVTAGTMALRAYFNGRRQ